MRVLFSTGSPAAYMQPPVLGDQQINCGPDWADQRDEDGRVQSFATPLGGYDLAALAAKLPSDQAPDVVVCLVDSSQRNLPRNLSAFSCPTVLLVADTHHLQSPLISMLRYVASEAYQRIVFLYDRHHLGFFRSAGLQNLYWFPGLTFPHADAAVKAARSTGKRDRSITFVGQSGKFHPRRQRLMEALQTQQFPLVQSRVSQRESLKIYGRSLIGLNASLNGDLNLRVFEVLASGAALLTDRLSPASGLTQLLKDGQDVITFGSVGELVERADQAIKQPESTRAIGRAGAKWFDDHMNETRRRQAFRSLAFDGTVLPEFEFSDEEKTRVFFGGNTDQLLDSLVVYESLQELHRMEEQVRVAMDPALSGDLDEVFGTLPRLGILRGAQTDGWDLTAFSRGCFVVPSATLMWCGDARNTDRQSLQALLAPQGYVALHPELALFGMPKTTDAEAAFARGEYGVAIELAQEAIKADPSNTAALSVFAQVARQGGKDALAREILGLVAHLDPVNPLLGRAEGSEREPLRVSEAREAFTKGRSEAAATVREVLLVNRQDGLAWKILADSFAAGGAIAKAIEAYPAACRLAPNDATCWRNYGEVLFRANRPAEAVAMLMHASDLLPSDIELHLSLARASLAVEQRGIARVAYERLCAFSPGREEAREGLARTRLASMDPPSSEGYDLIICHLEICRFHGTGVLLQRFFPDAGANLITIRANSLYEGVVEIGGKHWVIEGFGLSVKKREIRLRQMLEPFKIRRILCIPFYSADFIHGYLAKKITGAPLCTYVMDDQAVFAGAVPQDIAQWLFSNSELKLAISPEMARAYYERFGSTFAVLPPVLTSVRERVPNVWSETRGAPRCTLVGNIWSAQQFQKLQRLIRTLGLTVDWYGNAEVAWLPHNKAELQEQGIYCRGFLPEPELAKKLAQCAFVIVPSGELDGSEDNEWLTRLSLPSRMVFIMAQTFTPMLVLGSPETAAAGYVRRLGIGLCARYDPASARLAIQRMLNPQEREAMVASARRVADAFVMPNAGEWIWKSLAAGRAEETPLTALMQDDGERNRISGREICTSFESQLSSAIL